MTLGWGRGYSLLVCTCLGGLCLALASPVLGFSWWLEAPSRNNAHDPRSSAFHAVARPLFVPTPTLTPTPFVTPAFTTMPTPSPVPPVVAFLTPVAWNNVAVTQMLWKNGVWGTWCGTTYIYFFVAPLYTAGVDITSTADREDLNGDSTVLCLSTSTGQISAYIYPTYAGTADISSYIPHGSLQFDIRLLQPVSSYATIIVGDGCQTQRVPISAAGLSTSRYTHVSIPFTNFFNPHDVSTFEACFTLSVGMNSGFTGPVANIDAIGWYP
jgi:hypothetical protein